MVGLTGIVGEWSVMMEEGVVGHGFGAGKAVEGVPVPRRVNGEVGIKPCNCGVPVPAFFGSQKTAHVSL